jgi:lipopolysaccharide/colanic/teichoic acid biosynthesis glycosyltransferase
MTPLRWEQLALLAGDLVSLALSLWLALTFRNLAFPAPGYFLEHVDAFLPVFALSIVIFYVAGLYEKQTRLVRRVMGERIAYAQAANALFAAVLFFLLSLPLAPKTILLIYLVVSVLVVSAWRFYAAPRLSARSKQPALLIGSGAAVTELAEEIHGNGRYALRVEHLDTASLPADELARAIGERIRGGVRFVILDTRDESVRVKLPSLYGSMVEGVTFHEFSAFYEEVFDRVPLAHVDYAWLLECLPRSHGLYDVAKRVFDIVLALPAGIIALVFVIPASLLLALTGGQPFILHERIGRGGRTFRIVKLRTMLLNDHGDPELQKKNRVTALGRALRRTRIDELPQLWNILAGDLSFIGPRPELPRIAATYEREIPYYHVRHLIPPGLSGWAQIRDYDAPRGGADVERTKRKLSYDLFYLKRRSFGLDLAIAMKTVRALAAFSGT